MCEGTHNISSDQQSSALNTTGQMFPEEMLSVLANYCEGLAAATPATFV